MGIMYAMKCDLCGKTQVEEVASNIKGRSYTENSQTKFACEKCDELMKASIEIGARGLKNPLRKVAGLIKQRDQARRRAEEAEAGLIGMNPSIGHSASALQAPKGIQAAARIASAMAGSSPETQALEGSKGGTAPTPRLGRKKGRVKDAAP